MTRWWRTCARCCAAQATTHPDPCLPSELGAGPLLVISDVPKDVEPAGYGDRCPVLVVDLSQQGAVFQLIDCHGHPASGHEVTDLSQHLHGEPAEHIPFVVVEVQ